MRGEVQMGYIPREASRQFRIDFLKRSIFEWIIVFYFIFLFGAVNFLFWTDELRPRDNFVYFTLTLAFYLAFTIMCLHMLITQPRVIRENLPIFAFAALCPISILWSVNPFSTAVYGLMIFISFFSGVVLSRLLSLERFLELLYRALIICVGTSLLLLTIAPSLMIASDPRPSVLGFTAIEGVFPHKNWSAMASAVGFAIAMFKFTRSKMDLFWAVIFLVFGLLSGSASIFVLLFIVLAYLFCPQPLTSFLTVLLCLIGAVILFFTMGDWNSYV